MTLWVDADACPRAVREILFRAAERRGIELVMVANKVLQTPASKFIRSIRVDSGFDVADQYIATAVLVGDLVITADIPLAAEVVGRGAVALNPRGELYTPENISERLAVRDMMDELRSTRMVSGGPAPVSARDNQQFANQLDRWLAQQL
jgi:uncharacterized protein YaiI (UPF0178 family)